MGDRAQVVISAEDEGAIYLYTHWNGSELEATVQRALQRQQRWNDFEYLVRIIFCEMIKGNEAAETGFGIGVAEHGDNEYPLIIVDVSMQTVKIEEESIPFRAFIKKKIVAR